MTHGTVNRAQFMRMMGGLALGVATPGALAACGGGSSSGSALSVIGVADEKAPLDDLTKAYAASRSGTKFKTSYAPTDQVQTSVRVRLNSANAPDVHVLYPGSGSAMSTTQVAKADLLADLTNQSWTSAIPTNLKRSFQYQDHTYLFSAGVTVIGVIYNKAVFSAANVQIPKTWSEFLTACATFKTAGKVPLALGAQTGWVTQLITYGLVASNVYAQAPDFDDQQLAGKASFAQSGWHKSLQMYMDLRDQGYFNDNPNGTTLEQQTTLVGTGKAAMAVQVAPLLPAFRQAAPKAEDIGMFPFPTADSEAAVWTWSGANVGVGVHAKGKNLDGSLAFIDFLGKQENMNRWCELVSAIPLRRDANSKIDTDLASFLPLLDAGRVAPVGQRWPNPQVQPTHFAAIQELLAKKTSIDDALKKMDEVYRSQ